MENDPLSDLPFCSNEESLWSEIINPFLDSPNKNAPLTHIGRIIAWHATKMYLQRHLIAI